MTPARAEGYGQIRDAMREYYPRFSDLEYKRRHNLTLGMMDKLGLDCLLIYGDATLGALNQLNCHWISNYLDEQYSYVLFPREGDPTLYTSVPPDAAAAMAASPLEDVRPGGLGMEIAKSVGEGLKDRGKKIKRLGIVDNWALAPGLPYAHHQLFSATLPGIEIVNVAREYEDLRVVPSDEEMEWFRKGVALTDLGWEALVEAVEPGRTEAELLGVVHSAYLLKGGSYCFAILGSTPMADPKMGYPYGITQGSLRRIQQGDVVLCEMSASYYGYAGQCFCAVAVGEPPDEWRQWESFTRELYQETCAALKPGATESDMAPLQARVRDRGLDMETVFFHGWGTHFGHPIVGLESWTPWPIEIKEGELIMVEPNPSTPDALSGLQLGNLTQVGANGATALHKHGTEFVVK